MPHSSSPGPNADPNDGDSVPGSIDQLLQLTRVDTSCVPTSSGASATADAQGGVNANHRSPAASDTADFSDRFSGNLRIDYVLPSSDLLVSDCGVFWPSPGEDGAHLSDISDHHLVWTDIAFRDQKP